MKIFNVNGDEWDRVEDRQGWRSKDAWVGARIEAELIGGSAYEVEPGDRLCPYHGGSSPKETSSASGVARMERTRCVTGPRRQSAS